MGQQREHVRVVLVGDAKTGKTSLITVAASDHWPEHVPPVMPLTRLPSDLLPERMPVLVIDTSSRQEDWPTVEQELKKADAIIITYATDRQETFARLRSYWLPEVRRLKLKAPICLVGCKQDLRTDRQPALEQVATDLIADFPEVETTLECSAKAGTQVGEVFYYAQKAVMHPLPPLYDSRTQRLTPRCTRALKRIFTLCDEDKDGILSDDELNNFQVMCFNAPLQEQELAGVKSVVYEKLPAGVQDNGLTLLGFYLLHTLFIDKGRLETTWTVLRKFGYDDTVQLSKEILEFPQLRSKAADESVELTDKGLDFLRGLFLHFDSDGDGALSGAELEEAFSTAPDNPWEEDERFKRCTETNGDGCLTLRGFLVKWQLFALLEPQSALAYLIYLGFPVADISSAFRVTKRRRHDRKKKRLQRDVVQGFVFGSSGVGNSAIIDGLIDRSFSEAHTPTKDDRYAAQVVPIAEGAEKTLVLREVTGSSVAQLLGSESGLAACDVAAFVFDSTSADSLTEAVELLTQVADHAEKQGLEVPCTLIAAKRDSGDTVLAESVRNATELGLEAPLPVSIKQGETPYVQLVNLAMKPHSNVPETESSKLSKKQKLDSYRTLAMVGLATAVVGGIVAYRIYARHKQQSA